MTGVLTRLKNGIFGEDKKYIGRYIDLGDYEKGKHKFLMLYRDQYGLFTTPNSEYNVIDLKAETKKEAIYKAKQKQNLLGSSYYRYKVVLKTKGLPSCATFEGLKIVDTWDDDNKCWLEENHHRLEDYRKLRRIG